MAILSESDALLLLGISSPTAAETLIVQTALAGATASLIGFLQYDPELKSHIEFLPQMDQTLSSGAFIWEDSGDQVVVRRLAEASTNQLQLTHMPIRSITSLKVDYDGRSGARSGSFGSGTEWTEGVDFWPNYDGKDSSNQSICRDGILRSQGRWSNMAGTVRVEYVAGYSSAEINGTDSVINAFTLKDVVIDETMRAVNKVYSRRRSVLTGFTGTPKTGETLGDYSYTTDAGLLSTILGGSWQLTPENQQKLFQGGFVPFHMEVL